MKETTFDMITFNFISDQYLSFKLKDIKAFKYL